MKATGFLTLAAAAATVAMTLAGCSDERQTDGTDDATVEVRFTAGIDLTATPATRAAGVIWAAGDAVGIFMVGNGTTTVSGAAVNRHYTTSAGNGNFGPVAAADAIFFPADASPVEFIAYYPWATGSTLAAVLPVTVGTAQTTANQPGYDWLWGGADNSAAGYTNAHTGAVPLRFTHRMSKIVLDVTADAAIGSPAGMTVKVKGMGTTGTLDLATGTVAAAATPVVADIAMRAVTDGAQYDAIIIPATYAAGAATLEFTVGGKTYECDLPAQTYASANEYDYDVNIAVTGITITGTIVPWNTNDGGSLTAE